MGQFFLPPSDVNINLSDVTTSDSTTLKHGFLPKLSGVALQYLNGLGQWVAASGQEFIQGVSVANYAALPAAAANTGLMALVLNNSGIWLINFQSKGIYISDGINWNYEGDYVVTSTADHIANTPSGTITATDIQATVNQLDTLKIAVASKDVSSGVPGLTLFKINFKNVANTFTSFFTNSNTAARTYTFPDSNGSVLLDASIDAATLDSAPTDTAEFLYWSVVAGALRKITVAGLKSIFALVGGDSTKTFLVAPATAGTMAPAASQMIGRNLIVNGSCQVDQVNSGAIISPLVNGNYVVDNLGYYQTQTGKLSGQQITTSTLNTLGSTHAARATVLSQYTPISTDEFEYLFYVEGLNLAHLQWGTANASSVSLQFKVTASVAGTYSGSIRNPTVTRSYPFSYTVVANTPTLVKIENIPGETSGTWVTTNAASLHISFDFGGGSANKGTANTWATTSYTGVTGATTLVAQVNGSTLDISDVQLEKGAFCTTFERKLYDQVLRECRRYARKGSFYIPATVAQNIATIDMRATPTITGGGAGFTSTGTSLDSLIAYQTVGAIQTLLLEARL